MMMELTQVKMMSQEGKNLHIMKEMLQAAVEEFCCAVAMRKNLQQLDETKLAWLAAWERYTEANLDYGVKGPRETDYAIQESEMLKSKYAKMFEDVLEYFKSGEAPPEVEVANSKVEEQIIFKEEMMAKPEQTLAETLEKQRLAKELLAEDNQDLLVPVLKQEPQAALEEEEFTVKQAVMTVMVDAKPIQLQEVHVDHEDVCVKQEVDQEDVCLQQEVLVEMNSIKNKEEEQQRMLKEVRDCGGLDPGEAVNKVKVEKCGFKEKVWNFVIKDRVELKPEMRMEEEKYVTKDRMEVKHRPQEKGEAKFGDPKVRALVCNIFLNLEFELLLAWMMVMLHKTLRVRLVKFCTPSVLWASDSNEGSPWASLCPNLRKFFLLLINLVHQSDQIFCSSEDH